MQFITLYHRLKNREGDQLRWGDEIEYTIVKFDHENRKVSEECVQKWGLDEDWCA